ncbi:MAG: O-methyltransferase [Alphaproteobacteria bacterium]
MKYITNPEIEQYCQAHSAVENSLLKKVREDAFRFAPQADMCSDRLSGSFLRTISLLKQPKNILELGMFYGYATLCMAEGSPQAKITCVEHDGRVIDRAKDFFDAHPCKNEINVIHADANTELDKILSSEQFDFIFIDADKRAYADYAEKCCDHLQSGGVLIVDNTLWRGGILETDTDEKAISVDEANKYILNDDRFENVLLPVRDGMHLAIKR